MGVHGLWRLIEPSGKPVPLETLENKVLAVDISIWLHQAIKGFQDSRGGAVPNAHLLGIYHRVCKLLFFKIKPVFVFDGGVPALKKQTIAKRNQNKSKNLSDADKIQKQLLATLIKHSAINKVIAEQVEEAVKTKSVKKSSRQSNKDNLYVLPEADFDSTLSSSEDESESTSDSSPSKYWDLHNIDTRSVQFKSLPADVRHEILTDLKETRKQSSWGRLHELPIFSDDFSKYQMNRLLKRQEVQSALEDTEKEMGGHSLSLAELESLLKDQGVISKPNVGNRIASDENKRFLFIKDTKKALDEARKENEKLALETIQEDESEEQVNNELEDNVKTKADQEFEDNLQLAIALSLEESEISQPSTSARSETSSSQSISSSVKKGNLSEKSNRVEFSFLENFTDADFASSSSDEEPEYFEQNSKTKSLSSAQSYMKEYSGLTPSEIEKIIVKNSNEPKIKVSKKLVKEKTNEVSCTDVENSNKTGLNIIVDPNQELSTEDDLFNDIFQKVDTNENDKELPVIKNGNDIISNEIDDVEVMSCTSSSSDELLEVEDTPNKDALPTNEEYLEEKKEVLEIIVNPNANVSVEEDLFSDIFESKDEVKEIKDEGNLIKIEHFKKSDVIEHLEMVAVESIKTDEKTKIVEEKNIKKDENIKIIGEKIHENTEIVVEKAKKLNDVIKKPAISLDELKKMKDDLQKEKQNLISEKATKERIAGNMTDQIYQESQELLDLFGVPYIIAPMEAEAQCAFLDAINLTDGTITDDSDIWLFGGKTVYKNFFNQAKYVLEFKAEDIEHHFKLTREQMILLALLVGSDYTVGLQGVGPVTALEILSTFPPANVKEFTLTQNQLISGLSEFRSWFKKGKSAGPGRNALKNKLKNVSFTDNFPSVQVVQAYLDPTVDTSKEPFSWGKPNIMGLTEFARVKFGWTKTKTEEILKPVLKRIDEGRMQKTIKDFFKVTYKIDGGEVKKKMSKRVKTAVDNIGKDPSERVSEELENINVLKKSRKRVSEKDSSESNKPKASRKNREDKLLSKEKSSNSVSEETHKPEEKKTSSRRSKDAAQKEDKETKPKAQRVRKRKIENEEKPSTSTSSSSINTEIIESPQEDEILEKIQRIRDRRRIKDAIPKEKDTKKQKQKNQSTIENLSKDLCEDPEVKLLREIASTSAQRVDQITTNIQEEIKKITSNTNKINTNTKLSANEKMKRVPKIVHKKDTIPQKDRDKSTLLRNKLKAIEVFRKSKKGPGYVQKRENRRRDPKEDAELSESSDD